MEKMSKQKDNQNLDESGDQDQNIKVYENEAYMFNDENSNDQSNPNDDGAIDENDLHSNKNSNLNNSEDGDNKPYYTGGYNQNGVTGEDGTGEEEDPQQGDTVRNKEREEEEEEQEQEQEHYDQDLQNPEENEIEQESGDENESIPLITLKYISICQCCKNSFNSTIYIPYLFKCGHFFCKKCIDEQFTDDEGIKCPNDGIVALSLSELKLLNNLITDKNVEALTSRGNTCEVHKGQKLTHYIEDTKELICVYCAFARFKKNPKTEIKEIKEKCNEINSDLSGIIEDNQHNVEMIQSALKDIKKNKESEEKRVNMFFEQIMSYFENKKTEMLNQIDSLFTENARKLSQKLELFSGKMEESENLKNMLDEVSKNEGSRFMEILDRYSKITQDNSDHSKLNVQLQEYRFTYDDETKMIKYINNFGDLKIVPKIFTFNGAKEEIDFGFKNFKMNTSYNVGQSSNELLNNSELQNSTFDFRQTQNGRENKKMMFPSSSQTKNIMSKYSYNKPMTPGEYRTNEIKYRGINLK